MVGTAKTVDTHEAEARLAEYLDRAALKGERIVVERDGTPVAALVSMADLMRLEQLEQAAPGGGGDAARQQRYRRAMEEAGLVVQWPTGAPVPLSERRLIEVAGPPISEQIIADRR